MSSTGPQRRDKKTNEAARLAYLLYHAPALVVGVPAVEAGSQPHTPSDCIEYATARIGSTIAQVQRHLRHCRTPLTNRRDVVLQKNPQQTLLAALRRGASLTAARRIAQLPKKEIEAAWLAAERGEDNELGLAMHQMVGMADLDAQADYRTSENRRRQHDAGDFTTQSQQVDKLQRWNYYLAEAEIANSQLSLEGIDATP